MTPRYLSMRQMRERQEAPLPKLTGDMLVMVGRADENGQVIIVTLDELKEWMRP